jgi:phosphoribosyl-ATP pyrophosphohydrolase
MGHVKKGVHMLETLYKEALNRKNNPKEGSYTTYLFEKGLDKILKKVGEEATEVVIAAKNADQKEIAMETADILYHLAVMLVETGVQLDDVNRVLQSRQGKKSKVEDRQKISDY